MRPEDSALRPPVKVLGPLWVCVWGGPWASSRVSIGCRWRAHIVGAFRGEEAPVSLLSPAMRVAWFPNGACALAEAHVALNSSRPRAAGCPASSMFSPACSLRGDVVSLIFLGEDFSFQVILY